MGTDDPYTTVTESTFVARFLLDPYTDTVETVAVRELVRTGDITDVGIRCDDPRPGLPRTAKK